MGPAVLGSGGHAPSGLGVEVVQDKHDGEDAGGAGEGGAKGAEGGNDEPQVRTDQLWGP